MFCVGYRSPDMCLGTEKELAYMHTALPLICSMAQANKLTLQKQPTKGLDSLGDS